MSDTTTASSEPGQPLGLALTDQLGPLPEAWRARVFVGSASVYTEEQMRAYAAREVAAERERCAKKPLTAQQLDKLIEAHVGGAELADGEYSAMVLFAAAVERAHGIAA